VGEKQQMKRKGQKKGFTREGKILPWATSMSDRGMEISGGQNEEPLDQLTTGQPQIDHVNSIHNQKAGWQRSGGGSNITARQTLEIGKIPCQKKVKEEQRDTAGTFNSAGLGRTHRGVGKGHNLDTG